MRVLLLDTAFAAAPIYEHLVQIGHDVWVMGNRPNDLLAKKAGKKWINQDYSQMHEVEEHAVRGGIECFVPGCTDLSIEICLRLRFGSTVLDAPETNNILCNKQAFRSLCHDLGLPGPQVVRKEEFPIQGRFICKPVDAFSGRGITVFDGDDCDSLEEAYDAAIRASRTATALIETFTIGDLFSCSAFIDDQRVSMAFYVREGSSVNPFAVDTSYVAYDLPKECTELLEESLAKICSALRLKNGLLHTQFILTDGYPAIVEVSRRCPGDLYPLLIEYSTGFQYAAKYASYFIKAEQAPQKTERRYVLRHTVASDRDIIFEGLRLAESKPTRAFFPIHAMGQELLGGQKTRAGILFCEAPSYEQLVDDYELFVSRGAYEVA
ncbi:MAG TPA: hypothetical protein VMF32_00555 [Xanthobacteraceae bacterium]|nr:hypothetical protein [Xanthobacteraceae bacterium]